MKKVWIVTQQSAGDEGYIWVIAAFGTREEAQAFDKNHQAWLDRMGVDAHTDLYSIPFNPEYSDEGWLVVKKRLNFLERNLPETEVSPLEHIMAEWIYRSKPNEVNRHHEDYWVIVKAMDRMEAHSKGIELINQAQTLDRRL